MNRLSEDQLAGNFKSSATGLIGRPGWLSIAYSHLLIEKLTRGPVAKVLQSMTQRGVSQEMLTAAQRKREWMQQRKNVSDLADYYAKWEIATRSPNFGAEIQRGLDQIDSKRVQQVLGRWLLANGRNRAKAEFKAC